MVFLGNLSLRPGAPHPCDHIFDGGHFLSRDFSHLLGHFGLARETEAGLDFRIIHHRFGVGFAPGVAAPASLGAGKDFQDFFHFRIGFDRKFLGRKG
jgi:hypothetical protein